MSLEYPTIVHGFHFYMEHGMSWNFSIGQGKISQLENALHSVCTAGEARYIDCQVKIVASRLGSFLIF